MTGGRKMKKVIKYIVYLTINLLFIVELIKVIRLFDIKEIINIRSVMKISYCYIDNISNKIFPPSNAGIGNKFVTPNDNEISANI